MRTYEFYKQHDKHTDYLSDKLEIAKQYGFLSVSQSYEWMYIVEGKSHAEIAEIYGVTKQCIKLALNRMGVAIKPRGGPRNHNNFTRDDIIHIRKSYHHTRTLANHYKCSFQTISKIRNGKRWTDLHGIR